MLRACISLVLIICFSALGILLIRKKMKKKFLVSAFSVLWGVLIIFLTSAFPVENAFVTFDSPEEAVRYVSRGTLDEIIYGEDSCLGFSSIREGESEIAYVKKAENGYKLCGLLSVNKISHVKNDKIILNVYNVRNTSDYYISLNFMFVGNKEVEFYDSKGELIECEVNPVKASPYSWVYLNEFSDDYYMVLNGERIDF